VIQNPDRNSSGDPAEMPLAKPNRPGKPEAEFREMTADLWATRLTRVAIAAMFAYVVVRILLGPVEKGSFAHPLAALYISELVLTVLIFALTFTQWFRGHWRAPVFVLASALVASALAISISTAEPVAFFGAALMLMLGSAALVPWGPRWQLAFSILCLAACGFALLTLPMPEGLAAYRMLMMVMAAGLAQFIAIMAEHYRREFRFRIAALQENEEKLWRIFEASPDAVTINLLSDGRYLNVSEEFLKFGFSKDEIIGSTGQQLGIWANEPERVEYARQLRESGSVRNMEALFRKKNGELVPCLISGTSIRLSHGACGVSIVHDISRLKGVEMELVSASKAAQAASRAKSEFLSSMSHEIRTPMNAILGMADLLAESRLSSEQRKYLSIMINNGNALVDLINDILDFAKVENGKLELERIPFELDDLAERVAETLAIRAHQKQLELAIHIRPDVATQLVGDPLRLRQVLVNLIGNAIKFTESGEVVLTVERENRTDPELLHFKVSDTGIGIPEAQREKIFTSYAQAEDSTARKYGGTGLGLAIVKQLVEMMGGRIWIESEVGRGSIFHFTARFGLQTEKPGLQARPASGLNGLRVLLVDDSAINRVALSETLSNWDASVTCAEDGEVALAEMRRATDQQRPYQVILVDCRMPATNSAELVLRMKDAVSSGGGVIVPMLTSDDLNVRVPTLRKMGLSHYLIKPVRRSELAVVMRAAMGKLAPAEKRTPALSSEEKTSAGPAERPLNILLADDSADNRLLIAAFLRKTGWRLDEAENGEAAIQKFFNARFDVVIMDIQMPVMDGYTAVRKIRDWERERGVARTPIIALTASVLDEAVSKSIDAGCDTHVSKPVRRPTLLEAIREVTLSNPAPLATAQAANGSRHDSFDPENRPADEFNAQAATRRLRATSSIN
jgi:two-component system, sensor histidine kinase and response regulator